MFFFLMAKRRHIAKLAKKKTNLLVLDELMNES